VAEDSTGHKGKVAEDRTGHKRKVAEDSTGHKRTENEEEDEDHAEGGGSFLRSVLALNLLILKYKRKEKR
jgi:hypothetical protein